MVSNLLAGTSMRAARDFRVTLAAFGGLEVHPTSR